MIYVYIGILHVLLSNYFHTKYTHIYYSKYFIFNRKCNSLKKYFVLLKTFLNA